jgi:hypothetical protein
VVRPHDLRRLQEGARPLVPPRLGLPRHRREREVQAAYVIEHRYPTNLLQSEIKQRFRDRNPTLKEFLELYAEKGRLCLVHREEDDALNAGRLIRTTLADGSSRYADIEPIWSNIPWSGIGPNFRHLKRTLDRWRKEGRTLEKIEGLSTNGGRS